MQDVLVTIAKEIEAFNGTTPLEFQAWCRTIARNRAADRYRRKSVLLSESMSPEEIVRLVEAADQGAVSGPGVMADFSRALQILEELGDPCRSALTLHYLQGLDYSEIAELLGELINTVRMRIQRCLERAQALFGS